MMWDTASYATFLINNKDEHFTRVWEANEWMKNGELPDFKRNSEIEGEMMGAAFVSFVQYLRVFLRKKRAQSKRCCVSQLDKQL